MLRNRVYSSSIIRVLCTTRTLITFSHFTETDALGARARKARKKTVRLAPARLEGLDFGGEILFAERQMGRDYSNHYYANFGYDCGNENYWIHGGDGGRLATVDPRTGNVRTLISDDKGAFRDPRVSYDAKKVLFSYRKGGTHHYNLHEIDIDGSGLKQLTFGDWDDIEPCYLPDGDILFCSTRCKRYVLCWLSPVPVLFRCKADGSDIRQLSSGANVENTPAVLPDGRILYTRWEYVNRATTRFHQLWVMNPDGTGAMTYFGNMHPTGNVYIDAKPVPGTEKVIFVRAGHCSNEHAGMLCLLSTANGLDDLSQIKQVGGRNGIRDPYPVSSSSFLAAEGNSILLVTGEGKASLVFRSNKPVHEPQFIRSRKRERVPASMVDWSKRTGKLFLSNVYIGRNLKGLKPGSIKKLLVMEQVPKPVNFHGGGSTPLGHGGKWTINRILGTVPVEADGSAFFEVPACRSIYLGILDQNDLSVKQMRSFITVMPGEHASCIGCHEDRTMTPPKGLNSIAAGRAPNEIQPIAGVPEIMDFPRDIQPILDRRCVSCHNAEKRSGGVNLTGDRGVTYSLSYYNLMLYQQIKDGAGLGWPGVKDGKGEPLGNDAPYETFSSAAPLMKMIDGSHHDVKLTAHEQTMIRLWLDSATPYAGTYAAFGTGQIGGWWGLNKAVREMTEKWPSTGPGRQAMEKRCGACHNERMPMYVTDGVKLRHGDFEGFQRPTFRTSRHNIFNLTHPDKSLALMAALAKKSGGYAEGELPDQVRARSGRPRGQRHIRVGKKPQPFVHPVVFESKDDPDYQSILANVRAAGDRLNTIKRFDMPGFMPRYEYLREMKRYGVLPVDFDPKNPSPVDPYKLDMKYFDLFYPQTAAEKE